MAYHRYDLRRLWQRHICQADHPMGLIFLSLVVGVISASVATAFRLILETSADTLHTPGEFQLAIQLASLAIGGGLLIILFSWVRPSYRSVGVPHVLQQLHQGRGHLPLGNLLMQWFGSLIALISGHSLGREGPAIHLGAGCASQVGQVSGIPNHRLRILVGCGVAAAIAAFFNTPLAAMFLTMEVVLLGYSIRRALPIGLSAVIGSLISQWVFGDSQVFLTPTHSIDPLTAGPAIIALGIVGGLVAALFLLLVRYLQYLNRFTLWLRWGGLTLLTMLLVCFLPQLYGIGYQTINGSLASQLTWLSALLLLAGKLVLTAWAAAVRFPAGIIGPTLFVGAMFGAVFAGLLQFSNMGGSLTPGLCAMLGMGVMMGAVLRAPLAALITLLELSSDPTLLLPAIIAIISATLLVSEILKLPSIFAIQLQTEDDPLRASPITELLRSRWVKHLMNPNIQLAEPLATPLANPSSAVSSSDPATDTWLWMVDEQQLVVPLENLTMVNQEARIEPTATIKITCNLQDALDLMDSHQLHHLVVVDHRDTRRALGVISRRAIEQSFHYHSETLSR